MKKITPSWGLALPGALAVSYFQRVKWLLRNHMTLANWITIGRIVLVPVFVWLALSYGHSTAAGYAEDSLRGWALAVFLIASASDGLDGWVARHFRQHSKIGAFLDPLADKFLLISAVVTLAWVDWGEAGWRLPWWFALLVISRDSLILGGILWLQSRGLKVRIKPHWSGKCTTAAQMAVLAWVMLGWLRISPNWPCLVASAFTLISAYHYLRRAVSILRA